MNKSPWIADVTRETFQSEVVERSKKTPVLVDFWAEWCEPCRELGPLLERLAVAGKGRFFLAKVNVDVSPELAQMFRVQGIPMVLGLADGRIADGFTGAQTEAFLREFIDRLTPPTDADVVEGAKELASAGDLPGAIALLREHVAGKPDDLVARATLAQYSLDAGDLVGAKAAVEPSENEGVPPPEWTAVLRRIELMEQGGDVKELRARVAASPEDLSTRIEFGRALVAANETRAGLDELLGVVEQDRDFGEQAARKAILEVFEALGEGNPLVSEYRRRLQMVLF